MRGKNHVNLCKVEVHFPFLNGLLRLRENMVLLHRCLHRNHLCNQIYSAFVCHVKVSTGVCRHHLKFTKICEGETVDYSIL